MDNQIYHGDRNTEEVNNHSDDKPAASEARSVPSYFPTGSGDSRELSERSNRRFQLAHKESLSISSSSQFLFEGFTLPPTTSERPQHRLEENITRDNVFENASSSSSPSDDDDESFHSLDSMSSSPRNSVETFSNIHDLSLSPDNGSAKHNTLDITLSRARNGHSASESTLQPFRIRRGSETGAKGNSDDCETHISSPVIASLDVSDRLNVDAFNKWCLAFVSLNFDLEIGQGMCCLHKCLVLNFLVHAYSH